MGKGERDKGKRQSVFMNGVRLRAFDRVVAG